MPIPLAAVALAVAITGLVVGGTAAYYASQGRERAAADRRAARRDRQITQRNIRRNRDEMERNAREAQELATRIARISDLRSQFVRDCAGGNAGGLVQVGSGIFQIYLTDIAGDGQCGGLPDYRFEFARDNSSLSIFVGSNPTPSGQLSNVEAERVLSVIANEGLACCFNEH